jgi:hypothetical protein
MIKAFERATGDWPRQQIHVEYFTPKDQLAKKGGFVVELARSGREFVIPAGSARGRCGRRLFLRARHLRRMRAAGDFRHPRAPRRYPDRGGARFQHQSHDLLRPAARASAWCWISEIIVH